MSTSDLSIQRTLIEESNAARNAGDFTGARAIASEVVSYLLARSPTEQDAEWLALLNLAGLAAHSAQDPRTAHAAWRRVYEVRVAQLPDDHADLQLARTNLAVTIKGLGDLAGAKALEEKVLEVLTRTLPEDHAVLQAARSNLASTLYALGDLVGAKVLQAQVLEIRSRTLPDDHLHQQAARGNLALTMKALGDLAGAKVLEKKVLEVYSRTLPDDHPDLQMARFNLAMTIQAQGDLEDARVLQAKVLEVFSRTLPEEHPNLQLARQHLAVTIRELGDNAGAKALQERVLEVFSLTLPDDHASVQAARSNLAVTLHMQGDVAGAKALQEKVLEVFSRTLPHDHTDLLTARSNLAATLYTQGDITGAKALQVIVLEVRSRTLPKDHRDLQMARGNLAVTMRELGDLAVAKSLQETVLEVRSRTLPHDHPDLQMARQNLALTIKAQGDFAGAKALLENVLEVRTRTLPEHHYELQNARMQLALTLASEARSAGVGGDSKRETARDSARCGDLMGAVCRAHANAARAAILESPPREAEERCASLATHLDASLSFAQGFGVFEPLVELEHASLVFAETTRGAAQVSSALARRAAGSARYAELRAALREASDALAGLAQMGTTSETFDRARVKRESVERELIALARELSGGNESGVELDVESLGDRLGARRAAVAYRRYNKWSVQVDGDLDHTDEVEVRETAVASLCAFVVRSSEALSSGGAGEDVHRDAHGAAHGVAEPRSAPTSLLTLVDLGPLAPIEEAVRAWRAGLGVASESRGVQASARESVTSSVLAHGVTLRERILDPLLPALAGAERIVVVLDDFLHLVQLDALPLSTTEQDVASTMELVGDRWRVETRTTLTELLDSHEPFTDSGELLAFGDVEYRARGVDEQAIVAGENGPAPRIAVAQSGDANSALSEPDARALPSMLRGSAWSAGFTTLSGTGVEVRGIADSFADQFGDDVGVNVCEQTNATRERLFELAPKARYLHVATHGWFARESIRSWSDPEPLDKQSGLAMRMSGEEQVKGMSPMLLCGLALAGANLPEDAVGRTPGLVTADELSTLDLSNCELAVLSACDTNVGERRAGQGVASLQKALQMAGARSVITSLWKVPDEATKELMLDFYRRLWVEKKPKHQALWEAKTKLREAKDERGLAKYTTRDWAAWVLTGDPD